MKKIIVFFACAILIFGATLIGTNIYRIIKNNAQKERIGKIHLSAELVENSVRISGEYETGISKIVYFWNEEEKIEEMGNGKNKIEKLIDLPEGKNTLTIELIGTDGEKKEFKETFGEGAAQGEEGSVISISVVEGEYKLKILATNQNGLQYITYKWNLNQEVQAFPSETDPNTVEVLLDINRLEIGRGNNEITVNAVDLRNQVITETLKVEGRYEPEIELIQNGNVVDCTMSHDMGFESLEFIINGGEPIIYNENTPGYDGTRTSFKVSIPLEEGENIISITAKSREGTVRESTGTVTYTP